MVRKIFISYLTETMVRSAIVVFWVNTWWQVLVSNIEIPTINYRILAEFTEN